MSARLLIPWVLALAATGACGGADEHLPIDAATADAAVDAPDDAALDGPDGDGATGDAGLIGVSCARLDQQCTVPDQVCCDVEPGTDTCIPANDTCTGQPLACDGPEDCATGEECCFFQNGSGSRCLTTGICGTTGSISERMCHVDGDCDTGWACCGLSPGPIFDIYAVCRTAGSCPL